jgi:hypothetical protein
MSWYFQGGWRNNQTNEDVTKSRDGGWRWYKWHGKHEHQGEDEVRMLTTMEKNSQQENKRRKNQEDVDNSYGTSWKFNKKPLWIQFEKKKNNSAFLNTFHFGSKCDEWFIGSHLM